MDERNLHRLLCRFGSWYAEHHGYNESQAHRFGQDFAQRMLTPDCHENQSHGAGLRLLNWLCRCAQYQLDHDLSYERNNELDWRRETPKGMNALPPSVPEELRPTPPAPMRNRMEEFAQCVLGLESEQAALFLDCYYYRLEMAELTQYYAMGERRLQERLTTIRQRLWERLAALGWERTEYERHLFLLPLLFDAFSDETPE